MRSTVRSEWEPRICTHSFKLDLRETSASEIEVELPLSEEGEPAFLLYLFEHEPVKQARVKVSMWRRNEVDLLLMGSVVVNADEQYREEL
jgi:hypothetical protein